MNTMDVGDRVDLSGVVGRIERIGLRYTRLITFYNQESSCRTGKSKISRVFHMAEFWLMPTCKFPQKPTNQKAVETIQSVAKGMWAQFGAII